FFLDELVRRQWLSKRLAADRIVARRVPAGRRGAERTPGNAVARVVEAGERPAKALHPRQKILVRHEDVLHRDFAGRGSAQTELAFDLRRREALRLLALDEEAAHIAGFVLGPDQQEVRDGRMADPHLAAVEDIAAIDLFRAAFHAAGV